jgi:hypothetical protein
MKSIASQVHDRRSLYSGLGEHMTAAQLQDQLRKEFGAIIHPDRVEFPDGSECRSGTEIRVRQRGNSDGDRQTMSRSTVGRINRILVREQAGATKREAVTSSGKKVWEPIE